MRGKKYYSEAEYAVNGNRYIGDTIPKHCVLNWLDKYDDSTGNVVCRWTVDKALKLIAGISPQGFLSGTLAWESVYSWCFREYPAADDERLVVDKMRDIVDAFLRAVDKSERIEHRKDRVRLYCMYGERFRLNIRRESELTLDDVLGKDFNLKTYQRFAEEYVFDNTGLGLDVPIFGLFHDEKAESITGKTAAEKIDADIEERLLLLLEPDEMDAKEGLAAPQKPNDENDFAGLEIVPGVTVADIRAMLDKDSPAYCPRLLAAVMTKIEIMPREEKDAKGFTELPVTKESQYKKAVAEESLKHLRSVGVFSCTDGSKKPDPAKEDILNVCRILWRTRDGQNGHPKNQ